MSAVTYPKPLLVLDGKAVLNREEAAIYLGISVAKLDNFSNQGLIRRINIGANVRWLVSDLEAYLRSLR